MGFEDKRRPILESIMRHHGLPSSAHEKRLTNEQMREEIIHHIVSGRCADSASSPQRSRHFSASYQSQHKNEADFTCEDFVQSGELNEQKTNNEIAVLNMAIKKKSSRKTLLRIMRCNNIQYNISDSLKHLRYSVKKRIRVLEKQNADTSTPALHHETYIRSQSQPEWPTVIPQTLKDKIAANFRSEISREHLQTSICCSCSTSLFTQDCITAAKSDLNLSCLQHPDMRLSGNLPHLTHFLNDNLHVPSLTEGLLLDRRGIKDETLSLCNDCRVFIRKGKTPPLSLANHLLLGDIPAELRDLTAVEESMIARCRAKACIVHLKADDDGAILPNSQRGMRGHIVIYPQKPENLLNVLPPSIENVCTPICVVFIGSQRPTEEWLRHHAKPLIVRRERVRSALIWLKSHNDLYRDVIVDNASLNTFPENNILPVHIEVVNNTDAGDILTSRYDAQASPTSTDTTLINETTFDSVVVTDLNSNATVNQMRAAAVKHMKVKGGDFLQIPHAQAPANEFYNPHLLPMIYPTLFPYGQGGFEDLRRVTPLSFKRQVKHFFSLADRRFQEHYSFLFTVFNILQRRTILLQTSLKVKRSSFNHFSEEFNNISAAAVQRMSERLSQSDETSVFKNATPEERRILRLLKEVNVINTHVPGSSAARIAMRNEIRAMIMSKGLPSFYITINPADVYNPLVKFLAGAEIDIDKLLPHQVPNYMEQSILVARNPFVAAQFFNIYLKAFMKIVLGHGFSDDAQSSGILGTLDGYYGCVEAQGRGTLHCHMIIWLKGALNCNEIRDKVLAHDTHFQMRLINYINDCISNEMPPPPANPIIVPSDVVHPCSVRNVTDHNDTAARKKDMHNLVKSCQSHNHSATCYKYWKHGQPRECRFGLGAHRYRENTEFDSDGELQMRCLDGLVNNFNATILEIMRCNMDIQFLGSGPSTKAVIYYITDYITKAQLKTHVAYAALALAVQKLEQSDTADDPVTTRAKKLLQKCAYSMIARQELSAQQISSYLLDLEDHFTSESFQAMYWTTYEQYVNQSFPIANNVDHTPSEPHENTAEETSTIEEETIPASDDSDDAINLASSEPGLDEIVITADSYGGLQMRTPYIQDYLFRGNELQHLSLWEYTTMFQKIRKTKTFEKHKQNHYDFEENLQTIANDDDSFLRPKYHFDPTHVDYDTHVQQLRHPNRRPIPTPIGPSLPRRDKPDAHEKYCRLMLILLKPWNIPQDLISGHDSFHAAFDAFMHCQDNEKWKSLLNNMQLLHECRDNRDDHFESRCRARQTKKSYNKSGKGPTDTDDFESNTPETINDALLSHLTSIDDSQSIHVNESRTVVEQCLQEARLRGLFNYEQTLNTNFADQLGYIADDNTVTSEQEWQHEYDDRKQKWKSNIINEQDDVAQSNQNCIISDAAISNLQTASCPENILLNRIQATEPINQRKANATLNSQHTLDEFGLNPLQSTAYRMITEHSMCENPPQLRMYIAGAGGTGKSRIIDAVRHFFNIQHQQNRLRVTSFTGVASRNVHGMTLHSALCLNKQNKKTDKRKSELMAMWRKVDFLIIDEVSMIGCKLLLEIHEALCEAKENLEPFGGIHVIFVGDFAQLPPVGDTKLYSHIKKEQIATPNGQKKVFGKLLWLSIDKVIILNELVRQDSNKDAQFTALLGRLRTGLCTQEDYEFLSAKLLRNTKTNFTEQKWVAAPIIVSNNDVKDNLNMESTRTFATRTKQQLHLYYATDKKKGRIITDTDLRNKLWSYHSGKTEQRIGILPLCKGMPIMITQNYDVQNGIVNGCMGTLLKVNYYIDTDGYRHATSCIIQTENTSGPCLSHLNDHETPVLEDETTLTFTHPYSHVRSTFRRSQLPITPAFALTAHKSQGNTLQAAILDIESCLSAEAVYVMLSRVKDSNNIRLLRPFNIKKINTRCSEDLRKEFRRLEFLHNETLNSSMPKPQLNILGGMHDLEGIEKWYNERTEL